MSDRTLIQSFVRGRWFVSTCYRQSSAMLAPDTWYFETIVWEWDADKRERGAMLDMHESGYLDATAYEAHARVCATLAADCDETADLYDLRERFQAEDEDRREEAASDE